MMANRVRPLPKAPQKDLYRRKGLVAIEHSRKTQPEDYGNQSELNRLVRFMCLPPGVWKVVQEYCQQSSLHGLKYVSNSCLPYIERYFWLCIFVASFGFAVHLIYDVWYFWREQPFLITFDSHMTPVWTVPFPSVTICTYLRIKRTTIDLAATTNKTLLLYAGLVCPMNHLLGTRLQDLDHIGNELFDFIKQVSPTCPEVLKRCILKNKEIDCCEIFDPIITESGLCFIFNNLPLDRILSNNTYVPFQSRKHPPHARFWNPEDGYPQPDLRDQNESYTYPRWIELAGENLGLKLELFQNTSEWQQQCSGAHSGFQVFLNNPADLPISSKLNLQVRMSRETSFMLEPLTLHSRPNMASLSPRVRSCVFRGEHPLHFFSQYTNNNCFLDCLSRQFITDCGCVPYYHLRGSDTRICSKKRDMKCLQKARTKMVSEAIAKAVIDKTYAHPCDCFKGCQEISYSSMDFYTDFVFTGTPPPWGPNVGDHQITRVSIYVKDNQFIGKQRSVRYTNLKFGGTCGGLLSLLLGFSVISGIEVLYAFLLRPLSRALRQSCQTQRKPIVVKPASTTATRVL